MLHRPLPTRFAVAVSTLLMLPVGASAHALPVPETADRSVEPAPSAKAEQMWAMRRAQAQPVDFYMPYYTLDGGVESPIFLMNPIADPIAVSVTALDGRGDELPLGTYTIESRHHLELSLLERLRGFERQFGTGSLRLSLLGDADTLQGWIVLSTPEGQTFEMPISAPAKETTSAFHTFWDTTGRVMRGARNLRFEFLNTSPGPRRVEVTMPRGRRAVTESWTVPPGHRIQVDRLDGRPFGPRGRAEIRHDGEPGEVLAVGLLGARVPIADLPLVGVGEATERHHYESIPLPQIGVAGPGRPGTGTELVLFRPGTEGGPVTLEALDAATGSPLGETTLSVDPGAVQTVTLSRVMPATDHAPGSLRLRLVSEEAPLLVQGHTSMPDGSALELMFFPRESAHGNGTYPLPDPARYETATILVNVGEQASRIVAQITWDGGTYALGPFDVPAGAAHRVALDELADSFPPDLSGRELARDRPEAVLKWSILEGSDQLVARTEVTPRGRHDRFGFNCWGCCWQTPEGRIVPDEVEFTPGQERDFIASVLITDCAGTMGPYPATPDSLTFYSPFSWDGSVVTATFAADGDFSFEDHMTRITPTCASIWTRLWGFGRAFTCKKTFNPRNYSQYQTCSQQTESCYECKACCHNIAQVQTCQGKHQGDVQTNLNACLGICFADREGNGC